MKDQPTVSTSRSLARLPRVLTDHAPGDRRTVGGDPQPKPHPAGKMYRSLRRALENQRWMARRTGLSRGPARQLRGHTGLTVVLLVALTVAVAVALATVISPGPLTVTVTWYPPGCR
jgi:hypothetical protein